MKKNLLISFKLTLVLIVALGIIYPLLIASAGKASAGGGNGEKLYVKDRVVGYANVGQKFTDDKYFMGRPSAVEYNASGSAGSNKGPSNPDYLLTVKNRIDTFLVHNPGIKKEDIPADLVTASGSGLDPDISPAAALIQVKRIAAIRHLQEPALIDLVNQHTESPFAKTFGPSKVNVLKLNIALDEMK